MKLLWMPIGFAVRWVKLGMGMFYPDEMAIVSEAIVSDSIADKMCQN